MRHNLLRGASREQTQLEDDLISIFVAYGLTPEQIGEHVVNLLHSLDYP